MMRIIAGKHRSRQLELPESEFIRPTTDKAREALFSSLTHHLGTWDEARVLDACCGSGAMGLEALSRGAGQVVLMDNSPVALSLARRNAEKLREANNCQIIQGDIAHPPQAAKPCDVLLLDPPYNKGLAEAGLAALTQAGWAAPAAVATVEISRDETFTPPPGWHLISERSHGPARLMILNRVSSP